MAAVEALALTHFPLGLSLSPIFPISFSLWFEGICQFWLHVWRVCSLPLSLSSSSLLLLLSLVRCKWHGYNTVEEPKFYFLFFVSHFVSSFPCYYIPYINTRIKWYNWSVVVERTELSKDATWRDATSVDDLSDVRNDDSKSKVKVQLLEPKTNYLLQLPK